MHHSVDCEICWTSPVSIFERSRTTTRPTFRVSFPACDAAAAAAAALNGWNRIISSRLLRAALGHGDGPVPATIIPGRRERRAVRNLVACNCIRAGGEQQRPSRWPAGGGALSGCEGRPGRWEDRLISPSLDAHSTHTRLVAVSRPNRQNRQNLLFFTFTQWC